MPRPVGKTDAKDAIIVTDQTRIRRNPTALGPNDESTPSNCAC